MWYIKLNNKIKQTHSGIDILFLLMINCVSYWAIILAMLTRGSACLIILTLRYQQYQKTQKEENNIMSAALHKT